MEEEQLKLLKENNAMLKAILTYLINKNSDTNIANEDIKNFIINLVANSIICK